MGNKGSFVFYTEYREHLSMLPPEQVGELMFALMDYQETGEVPDLPKGSALAMCFSFIKKRMDKDNSKYEERCERNRSNGKKGGRPTKETEISKTEENPNKPNGFIENRTVISETEENPTEPQKADNDNEYDNDSDNEEYIHTPSTVQPTCKDELVIGDKVKSLAAGSQYYLCPIIKLQPDSDETEFTEEEAPALTIFLKKDVQVDHEWLPKKQRHDITASKYYGAALTNASKVVLAKFKK